MATISQKCPTMKKNVINNIMPNLFKTFADWCCFYWQKVSKCKILFKNHDWVSTNNCPVPDIVWFRKEMSQIYNFFDSFVAVQILKDTLYKYLS